MVTGKQNIDTVVSYKNTLNLPQTDFPIRPSAAIDDPVMILRWERENLYLLAQQCNSGATRYIVHDGPPYANGHIHLGHAYNKILKDIFAKSARMSGFHAPVVPGWDCHGLPIELKVTTEFPTIKGAALKEKCREYAHGWIEIQKEEFKRLGIVMEWDNPYLTMDFSYQAAIVRAFGIFFAKDFISRKNKTVPWCASCETVLASAEIEYQDRKDPSIYVAFALKNAHTIEQLFTISGSISLAVWTTTPWTLPLNRAVVIKPGAMYDCIVIAPQRYIIVGSALSQKLCEKMNISHSVVGTCMAEQLIGMTAQHPFIDDLFVPVLADHFVDLADGTACVHSAPGCGPEDYEFGIKNNLEIYSPLTSNGCYSSEIQPQELSGKKVSDVLGWIMNALQEHKTLLHKESIKHPYPHCWRCRNGLIFRATKQWFCELSHNGLRDQALDQIEKIKFIPERTKNHLKASLSGRLEWCLSRQRVWGIPIPSLVCVECDTIYCTKELIEKAAIGFEREGIEYWDNVSIYDLISNDVKCSHCMGKIFKKEQDILDVWFDSGVSHFAVLQKNSELIFPADIYIEGTDQHRGWFQSSLLTSIVLNGVAPMKMIATHGYTVDSQGRKMSKSLGNVVAPQVLIDELGTDGLRLWVSSIEMEGDVVVSSILMNNIKEVYRKIRNTCRFLLSNLYDFNNEIDSIEPNKLLLIDQYAMHELLRFNQQIRMFYNNKNLTGVYHTFTDFCTTSLSSLYLDIIKDRLYTDAAKSYERRSAQSVCWHILESLTTLMAPILSFGAEQISDLYQKNKKKSIHLQRFAATPSIWNGDDVLQKEKCWKWLCEMRTHILKIIERIRERSIIKHSLEAKIVVLINGDNEYNIHYPNINNVSNQIVINKFFKEFCIVSQAHIIIKNNDLFAVEYDELIDDENEEEVSWYDEKMGVFISASHADGIKCPRCWQWEITSHEHSLCARCSSVVSKI